ncbi:MAG: BrnA antitoxin family protein [Rickettsiales bacterium]|jgi:uncharacterized protein (DUF4415 family)|nr:BrnA antitoxin family protein [Rickettsiales bacterium]
MGKIIRMTAEEIRKEYGGNHDKIMEIARNAPAADDGFADWVEKNNIQPVARGFAQFKEFINRNGRPKSDDPKVSISIRVPLSVEKKLRGLGRGWQTKTSDYISRGVRSGAFAG